MGTDPYHKICPDDLPEFGELVLLHFFDGSEEPASREKGERLPDQWFWRGASGLVAADHPLLLSWSEIREGEEDEDE